ncbi:MAG: hypothetical protein NDJ89_08030 [Oligoflexia bacterium]|nr:hypothetical protein [Oligoflexia bacterium]
MKIFAITGLVWCLLAAPFLEWMSSRGLRGFVWFLVIWGISLADLLATGKLVSYVLSLVSDSKKQAEDAIQAFAWGALKLACFGLLGAIMVVGKSVPTPSLLLGLATLVVVPLGGGLWWYQRVLRHA